MLPHWTKLQKETQFVLAQVGCLQIGFMEPLYTRQSVLGKKGNEFIS